MINQNQKYLILGQMLVLATESWYKVGSDPKKYITSDTVVCRGGFSKEGEDSKLHGNWECRVHS